MIKGIVFDYDGVIMDSFLPVFKIHNRILEMHGKRRTSVRALRHHGGTDWKDLYRGWGFTDAEIEKIPPVFISEAMKLKDEFKFFSGIDEIFSSLHHRFRFAIVSNGDRKRIRFQLKEAGMLRFFDVILGFETGRIKPDPYQLQLCMKRMRLLPSELCYVGDTYEDILTARNAKLAKAIAVSYGNHPKEKLTSADAIAHSPSELLKVLEAL